MAPRGTFPSAGDVFSSVPDPATDHSDDDGNSDEFYTAEEDAADDGCTIYAFLRVVKADNSLGAPLELNMRTCTLGRGSSCVVAMSDPTVSRLHAELLLSRRTGLFVLRSCTSGRVCVDAYPLHRGDEAPVHHRSVIDIGPRSFLLEYPPHMIARAMHPSSVANAGNDGANALADKRATAGNSKGQSGVAAAAAAAASAAAVAAAAAASIVGRPNRPQPPPPAIAAAVAPSFVTVANGAPQFAYIYDPATQEAAVKPPPGYRARFHPPLLRGPPLALTADALFLSQTQELAEKLLAVDNGDYGAGGAAGRAAGKPRAKRPTRAMQLELLRAAGAAVAAAKAGDDKALTITPNTRKNIARFRERAEAHLEGTAQPVMVPRPAKAAVAHKHTESARAPQAAAPVTTVAVDDRKHGSSAVARPAVAAPAVAPARAAAAAAAEAAAAAKTAAQKPAHGRNARNTNNGYGDDDNDDEEEEEEEDAVSKLSRGRARSHSLSAGAGLARPAPGPVPSLAPAPGPVPSLAPAPGPVPSLAPAHAHAPAVSVPVAMPQHQQEQEQEQYYDSYGENDAGASAAADDQYDDDANEFEDSLVAPARLSGLFDAAADNDGASNNAGAGDLNASRAAAHAQAAAAGDAAEAEAEAEADDSVADAVSALPGAMGPVITSASHYPATLLTPAVAAVSRRGTPSRRAPASPARGGPLTPAAPGTGTGSR